MNMFVNNLPHELQQRVENLNQAIGKIAPGQRGERLIESLGCWLLDDEQKQFLGLNPWNIFFLFAAAHLFEMGTPPGNIEARSPVKGVENFPMTSAQWITTHWKTLGMVDEDQAGIIALICSNIRRDAVDSDRVFPGEKLEYEGVLVNIPLLSSAIHLAAQLDLEHPNTSRDIAADLTHIDQIPFEQFCKSFNLLSTGPHGFLPGTIQVKISCCHPRVHQALKQHETKMQRLLHSLNSRVSPRFLFSEIIYEIEPTGYIPLDMKFSVDSTAALQLLTGNRLYSDKRVFLRELIQNAVDACNLKKLFGDDYTPEIAIEFDDPKRIIKFRDNGIGMDRQWIEKYFLKIGISFYQSGDLKTLSQNRVDLNFISKFGIGFLSSFLVSDKIAIRTRKNDSPGLLITITSLQDYFDVSFAPADCPIGTEVTLYLLESHNNYCRSIEYIGYLKTNIRFLTIPVELRDHQGKTTLIGQETLAYDPDNYAGCNFITQLKLPDSEGYIFLKAMRNFNDLYGLEPAKGGVSVFQDGIFVTQTDALLPEGARQNVIGRINLTGKDRCELSMDRNRIFWTEQQLQNIKRTIRLGMVDLAKQLLTDTQALNPPLTINPSLINHLAIFFDFNEIDDEMFAGLGQPVREIVAKRFRDFIRINFAHTRKKNPVPEADGYGEKWQQKILATFAKRSRPPLPVI